MRKKRERIIVERLHRFSWTDPITGLPRLGRPPRFSTPEQMEEAGVAYFRSCWRKVKITKGKGDKKKVVESYWKQVTPYTISGLAFALGMDRVTLLDYEKNLRNTKHLTEDQLLEKREVGEYVYSTGELSRPSTFCSTVKRLKAVCQIYGEERLFQGHAAGPIFNLCNNYERWHQKQITELGGSTESVPISIRVDKTDERI